MTRSELTRVREIHRERVQIAYERNGAEHGLNHSLWGLGCYLYGRGVPMHLTLAERAFGMTQAAYALGHDAQDEAFANDILSAIKTGGDPLAVRARKISGRNTPVTTGKEAVGTALPLTASNNRKAA